MKNIINEREGFILLAPKNCYDTNYHLIDTIDKVEYLIDIHDVYDNDEYEEMELNGGISWDELRSLEDVGLLIYYSWKMKNIK